MPPPRRPVTPALLRRLESQALQLHRAGRVEIFDAGPHRVQAEVDDGEIWTVEIDGLGGSRPSRIACDCGEDPCAHVLATFLALTESMQVEASSGEAVMPEWLVRVTNILGAEASQPEPTRTLDPFYVVDEESTRTRGRLNLRVLLGRRDGRPGRLRTMPYHTQSRELAEADRAALSLLQAATDTRHHTPRDFELPPSWLSRILPVLGEIGRLRIARFHGSTATDVRPLQLDPGPAFTLRGRASFGAAGGEVSGWLQRGDEQFGHEAKVVLLDGQHALVGDRILPVDLGQATELARNLLLQGPMRAPAETADQMVAAVVTLPGAAELLADSLTLAPAGTPELRVVLRSNQDFSGHALCEATFAYGDKVVEVESPPLIPPDSKDGPWLQRDIATEDRVLEGFERAAAGLLQPTGMEGCYLLAHENWIACLRALVAQGIRVFAEGRPIRRADRVHISIRSGIDWFDLRADLQLDDGSRVPVGPLLAAIRKGERLVELADGSAAILEPADLARIESLLRLGKPGEDGVRLQRNQAWLLDAMLLAQRAEVDADAQFRAVRDRLGSFQQVAPVHEPDDFQGELRPYQRQGLGWLHFLRELGLGGCLADDMGLGKTVQVLALLQEVHRQADRPSLLVVPRSLLDNWMREAARFAPKLRVLSFHGADRWDRLGQSRRGFRAFDLVLTTYGTLRVDVPRLETDGTDFEYAVLDEAQAIENEHSQTSRAVRLLRARHRLCLTGTPVQNHIGELWALFEFLNPGLLGRSQAFRELLAQSNERGQGVDLGLLQRALAPFLLRRTKQAVLPDLPAKQEQDLWCDLEGPQRERYDALRGHYRRALLHGQQKLRPEERFVVLEALLRLRQAACHEGLLDDQRKGEGSAKLDALLPMLAEIAGSGHKALVFSQFTTFLGIVRQRLDGMGLSYQYLDGRTRDRQARVDAFQQDPDCPLFLISLKAGGFGLNLTAADYVFLLDPWWNPAAEAQAIDRAHRIGRTGKVTAYRLIARDTVEEKVLLLQKEKRALVDAVLGGNESLLAGLTREDLAALLG